MYYLIQYGYTVHGYGETITEAARHAAQNGCETTDADDIPMLGDSAVDGDLYFVQAPEIDGDIDPTDLIELLVSKAVFTKRQVAQFIVDYCIPFDSDCYSEGGIVDFNESEGVLVPCKINQDAAFSLTFYPEKYEDVIWRNEERYHDMVIPGQVSAKTFTAYQSKLVGLLEKNLEGLLNDSIYPQYRKLCWTLAK